MTDDKIDIFKKVIERERLARKEAESILEKKSLELYEKNEELISINNNLSTVIEEKTSELNDLFNNITDSYILMDLHGNVLKMNSPAIDFFGFDLDVDNFNVTQIIYEEDYEYAYESFYTMIETGSFKNYQARIYTKSREIKWVQINCSIVRDLEGMPTFAHGIVRDITNAKSRQKEFEEQKQQLDAIVDHSSLGIALTELGQIIRTNKAFEDLVEYSKEELLELHVKDISVKEDVPISVNYMDDMNSGKIENFSITKRYKAKSGKIIWAKTSVAAVRREDKSIKYQVAVIEDITEELKQGALLEALNNLMASLLGKTDVRQIAWEITKNTIGLLGFEDCVIYLFDEEEQVLSQIAAYGEKLTPRNEIINQISIPLGKGVVGSVAKNRKAEIISDTSLDKRYIVDDKIRFSEIAVPIISNNELIGVIDSEHSSKNFFTEDHLKTLQTIATLVSTKLKYALSLKLKEKVEKEKEVALKDLQKSNQELNDFAHVVSHDLKSPLRSMNALVNWLQEDCEKFADDEITANFNRLLKKIDRMDLLINGILSYASIDKVEKVEKKIDLQVIVNDILEIIHIPENFQVHVKSKMPTIKGDSYKLIQLFQNLIGNAVKYIEKEKGVVEIDCKSKKDFWEFSVSDNGKGIEEKYYKKIFKVFQVLEKSEESTGVGLSIVQKIINFYGGKIWVKSEIKKGSTFYFTLPK